MSVRVRRLFPLLFLSACSEEDSEQEGEGQVGSQCPPVVPFLSGLYFCLSRVLSLLPVFTWVPVG